MTMVHCGNFNVPIVVGIALLFCGSGCQTHPVAVMPTIPENRLPSRELVPSHHYRCAEERPFYGYQSTCWHPWPEGWIGCPPAWEEELSGPMGTEEVAPMDPPARLPKLQPPPFPPEPGDENNHPEPLPTPEGREPPSGPTDAGAPPPQPEVAPQDVPKANVPTPPSRPKSAAVPAPVRISTRPTSPSTVVPIPKQPTVAPPLSASEVREEPRRTLPPPDWKSRPKLSVSPRTEREASSDRERPNDQAVVRRAPKAEFSANDPAASDPIRRPVPRAESSRRRGSASLEVRTDVIVVDRPPVARSPNRSTENRIAKPTAAQDVPLAPYPPILQFAEVPPNVSAGIKKSDKSSERAASDKVSRVASRTPRPRTHPKSTITPTITVSLKRFLDSLTPRATKR